MFGLVLLGVILGWVESAYGKSGQASDEPVDAYDWDAGFSLKIPGRFRNPRYIPVEEPDDTPTVADKYVRFMARSRR